MTHQTLTKKEASKFLNISSRTLDRYRAMKLVKAVKAMGKVLFRPADLEAFLKKHEEK